MTVAGPRTRPMDKQMKKNRQIERQTETDRQKGEVGRQIVAILKHERSQRRKNRAVGRCTAVLEGWRWRKKQTAKKQ